MAKVLKKDEDVAKKEAREQARLDRLNEDRIKFIEGIKRDARFKRFVVEEILDPLAAKLIDVTNIDLDASPDEVKRTLAASKAAHAILMQFRGKIT